MTTDSYARDKRSIVGWIAGIVAVLFTTALGVLATQLSAHETAVNVLKEKQTSQERRFEEWRTEQQRQMESMNFKLDKIIDRLPPK